MLEFFRFFLLLIDLNHQKVLNCYELKTFDLEHQSSLGLSFDILQLIVNEFLEQIQEGLTLTNIENMLFFILFLRFLILAIRYNIKTSLYITCIGLFAGYLWYKHLIDLISTYRSILIKLPYLNKLGLDSVQLRTLNRQMILTDSKLGENVHWYNPGQLIYYALIKGIIHIDLENGLQYYIDPISMLISKLNESEKSKILPTYYIFYNKIIPQIFETCKKFWTQLSGIGAYAMITRIGKRYCPYLIRWHWTFLLILGLFEQILIYFVFRISYFQSFVLIPQTRSLQNYLDPNLILQINFLNETLIILVSLHLSLIFFGLFHAIWGQYFYFPFLVENTELHIGLRPKNSIYSGGNTAWQDKQENNYQRRFPKIWYGWFGSGLTDNWNVTRVFKTLLKNLLRQVKRK